MLMADAFWVGRLGASEMAAVTSSLFPIWTVFSMLAIISIGSIAIISRAVGARQPEEVSRATGQSLRFAIWAGLGYGLVGFLITPWIFELMGTEPEVTQMGVRYLRIFFVGVVFFFVNDTFMGFFRAIGDTKAALFIGATAIITNIVLDPLLIFGIGPFPALGTQGASIATITAAMCGALMLLILLKKNRYPFPICFNLFDRFDWRLIRTIIRIGFPPAIAYITFSVVYIFLNSIVASFGTVSIAGLLIGNRLESISYMTCFGFSIAASTLVGQNLGANQAARAARSGWTALGIAAGFTLVISILFLFTPGPLARIFTGDEEVIAIAIGYLQIIAISQIFMAAEIVLEGAFSGAGNTIPPMVVSIPGSIARLPLAYYLAVTVGMGINGVWWALTLTTILKGLVIVFWFSMGRWKKTGLLKKE